MIDWLRKLIHPSTARQLPTDLERTAVRHKAIIAKADRVIEDFRRMDIVIVRKRT